MDRSENTLRIGGVVQYDGSHFSGWQIQPKDVTVQGELEQGLFAITGQSIRVTGSGRTDAGVHGVGQVFHFDYDGTIPPEAFSPALNSQLPRTMRVISTWQTSADFHARFSATQREYRYVITPNKRQGDIFSPYSWTLPYNLDIQLLNQYASYLVGTHDFTSFCAKGDPSPSKVRDILSAWWYPKGDQIVFRIVGRSFLWKMVRTIVGTSVDLARDGKDPVCIQEILDKRERNEGGVTAPPEGLFFYKVSYGDPMDPKKEFVYE